MAILLWSHKYLAMHIWRCHLKCCNFPCRNWITELNRLERLWWYDIFCAWLNFWYLPTAHFSFVSWVVFVKGISDILQGHSDNCMSAYYVGSIIFYCRQAYLDVLSCSFLQMLQDRSYFWECYIWATASEVLGREAAARGSKRRPDWFNLINVLPSAVTWIKHWIMMSIQNYKCVLLGPDSWASITFC